MIFELFSASRLSSRSKSPDHMSSSYYSTSATGDNSRLMTQSLDPSMLSQTVKSNEHSNEKTATNAGLIERCLDGKRKSTQNKNDLLQQLEVTDPEPVNSPLQALSKLVPVPESLMSPDYHPSPLAIRTSTPSTIPTPLAKAPAKIAQPVQRSPKLNRAVAAKNRNNMANEARRGANSPTPPRQRKSLGNIANK